MDTTANKQISRLYEAEQKTFSRAGIASTNADTSSVQVGALFSPFGKDQQSIPSRPAMKTYMGIPSRQPRENRPRERDRVSVTRDDGDSDSQSGRKQGYYFPDNQQLFVGNLPQNITEKELKNFFEEYGHVVELRINTISGSQLPVKNMKNTGFVVFDNPEPVQTILSQHPIKYDGEHILTVEEKKSAGGAQDGGRGGPPRGGIGGGRDTGFGVDGEGGTFIRVGGGPRPGQRSDRGSMGIE